MSIPSIDRIEYPASTLGIESKPQGILAKGTLWTLQLGYSRLFLKEYGGSRHELDALIVKSYILTAALKLDLSIDPDRLWVWIVDLQNNLSLYEFEPYTDSIPVLTYSKLSITTNINSISVFVSSASPVRIAALYNTNEFKSIGYENIRLLDPPVIGDLSWGGSRLNQFDIYFYSDRTALEITYLDVASPPNVYIESYSVAIPTNFNISQIGNTNEINLSWDAVVDADSYVIDRATEPTFLLPVSITTSFLTYSDFVLDTGTYYYRIRAVNSALLLWSPWSGSEQITLSILADFYGVPLSVFTGDTITFTDISTPAGTITSWDWDFGDESSHSILQNPTHSYSTPGTYTVTLIAYSMSESDTIIKIDYISITPSLLAAFIGDPLLGDANLLVGFTDISLGYPISWDWNFGDGSSHSFVEDPNHVYTKAGLHTVSLTISDGINESTTTIVDYISVSMVADFSSDIQIGPADLTVHFTDQSLGEPTFWDWDFGDGSLHSTLQNPVHIYTDANNYTVTLIAYNSEASDTETKTNYITVSSTADFFAEPRTGYSTLSVQFIDLSKGNISSWYWDFGDSHFSTEQNPIHFYSSPGEYTITLVASSSFNSDSEIKVNYIIVSGIATPDIAPEPDILMYLSDKVNASRNNVGIKINYRI